MRGQGDRVEVEHQVGDHGSGAGPGDLSGDVGQQLPRGQAPEDAVGEGHHRVEVGPRHRPEREDEGDEPARSGGGVREELDAAVGGKALGEDPGPDDDGDEQRGTGGFGGDAPPEGCRHRFSSTDGVVHRRAA